MALLPLLSLLVGGGGGTGIDSGCPVRAESHPYLAATTTAPVVTRRAVIPRGGMDVAVCGVF